MSGLELALDARLRGTPGGELLAGRARARQRRPRARPAAGAHHASHPPLQHAAVAALGGQYGGVVALEPSSGAILAVAGIGLDDLQPPGSTFKMITLTAALEAGVASPQHRLPLRDLCDARRGQAAATPTARTAAARWRWPSRCPATRSSPRSGSRWARRGWWRRAERFGFNHAAGRRGGGGKHAPPRLADPGRTGRRLDRHRPGRRCRPARWRWPPWPPRSPTAAAVPTTDLRTRWEPPPRPPSPERADACDEPCGGPHRAPPDGRRRARRHRHRGGDPRRDRRRQDRHGGTGHAEVAARANRNPNRARNRARLRNESEHERMQELRQRTRRTPTPGSPPSPRRCTRASSWACCWCATAPAATPPRRSRGRCSRPVCRQSGRAS